MSQRIGWFLGLTIAGCAALATAWLGGDLLSARFSKSMNEAAVTTTSLARGGAAAMPVQRVDRYPEVPPYLGITYLPVNPRVASRYGLDVDWGVLVTAAVEAGPAHRAGVRAGDVVLFFDGAPLGPETSFLELLWAKRPGQIVGLVVWRDGRHFTTEAVLGMR